MVEMVLILELAEAVVQVLLEEMALQIQVVMVVQARLLQLQGLV
jgi:hypothetical protein